MSEFAKAAAFARRVAWQTGRSVVLVPSAVGGWTIRHEDGSIPTIVDADTAAVDTYWAERSESDYVHSKVDGPNASYYREQQLEAEGTSGLQDSY